MEKYTVDRFEGNYAVLISRTEDKQLDIPIRELPNGVQESDIIELSMNEFNEVLEVRILDKETRDIKDRIKKLQQKLINKDR